jgi:hypothetical protein
VSIYSYNGDSTAYIYKFFTDQCGHYKKEGDCYNREHSFPKTGWEDEDLNLILRTK